MNQKLLILKGILLVLSEIEMLFFSGISFGMNSLFPTLSSLHYFCSTNSGNTTCPEQQQYFGYLLITMFISFSLIAVPIGVFYDIFGNLKTKIIAAILIFLGCLFYAISSVTSNFIAFFATLLLGAWAQTILTCNFALSSYYPAIQNKIVSVFSGSFDSSSFMMTFITMGYRGGISLLVSFVLLSFVGLFLCITTGILFHYILKIKNKFGIIDVNTLSNGEIHKDNKPHMEEDNILNNCNDEHIENMINEKYPTLRSVLLSRHYIMHVLYLTILFFRFSFFLAQLNLQLNNLFPNDIVFVNILLFNSSYIFVCAIVISPLPGIVVDALRKNMRTTFPICDEFQLYGRSLICFAPNFIFTTSLSLIMSILILIPSQATIYCSLIAMMVMRVILFSTNSIYLLLAFPKKYFGKIFGIGSLISGAISFIQYGLLFQDYIKLNTVNYILIPIVAVTYLHPFLLLFKR